MSDMRAAVTEQMQQLQTLMHRLVYHGFAIGGRAARNPYRGQGRVLAALRMKPEISQKELTYLLGMSKQSLAELLAKLERSGCIEREQSEDDRRSVTVRLLEPGRQAAQDLDDGAEEVSQIFDCLDQEELEQFSAYMGRIIRRCAEFFPGEDLEERRQRMESFLRRYDHSFTQCENSLPHSADGAED